MKLQQYFLAYDFEEIYPLIGLMFPKARHQRAQFRHAYELLKDIKPVASKKVIRYQLMQDPDTQEVFCGADDNNFKAPWDVIVGKEVKKDQPVDLTDAEITANCLLNTVLIGKHPKSFISDFESIIR